MPVLLWSNVYWQYETAENCICLRKKPLTLGTHAAGWFFALHMQMQRRLEFTGFLSDVSYTLWLCVYLTQFSGEMYGVFQKKTTWPSQHEACHCQSFLLFRLLSHSSVSHRNIQVSLKPHQSVFGEPLSPLFEVWTNNASSLGRSFVRISKNVLWPFDTCFFKT